MDLRITRLDTLVSSLHTATTLARSRRFSRDRRFLRRFTLLGGGLDLPTALSTTRRFHRFL
ncbi:hypothetical protein A5630_16475 [Mycolicibacterium mucogenicum]|uniref:Uncharacterized protein n=1 Tax=Mycolicibacterium mucogenicum TaxID=56689 RepID=A0A1A3HA50_MYCMU|nr:hypothetical protein A5630_16475 [Mycolicibacterium mucogenicum]